MSVRRGCRPSAVSGLLLLLAAASALAACGTREVVPFKCDCDYLTDYDDPARQSALVCADDQADALAVGQGCAQRSAPAPIRTCTCVRASPTAAGSQAAPGSSTQGASQGRCRRGCLDQR